MVDIGKIALVAVGAIIGILVLLEVSAAVIPSAQTAGNTLNATGIPLGNLFVSNGVLFTLISVGLLVAGITLALSIAKRKGK